MALGYRCISALSPRGSNSRHLTSSRLPPPPCCRPDSPTLFSDRAGPWELSARGLLKLDVSAKEALPAPSLSGLIRPGGLFPQVRPPGLFFKPLIQLPARSLEPGEIGR